MTTRRKFLKIGAGAGAGGLLTPWGAILPEAAAMTVAGGKHTHTQAVAPPAVTPLDPRTLSKYVDALPGVPVLAPAGRRQGATWYEVAMTRFSQKLHAQLPPTTVWGYGDARQPKGSFPGPTIQVARNERVQVRWINDIRADDIPYPSAYDTFIHGAMDGEPRVKTVVHVHGARVAPHSDGFPDAWFTRGFARKGPAWEREVYEYDNRQEACTLWYHDHAVGQTRLNVYAGLAGAYLVRGEDDRLGLPAGDHEWPLVIQDRMFATDGALLYPVRDPDEPRAPDAHPGPWVPEFFGDTILVNGKAWPFMRVEPRRYRFRILNGSNARFYNLRLSSGQPFFQIAAEQGLFQAPVRLDTLLMAPGERADVIVDFSGQRGDVFMTNDAPSPFPDGDPVDPATTGQIMKFSVTKPLAGRDTSVLPDRLGGDAPLRPAQARLTRNMSIIEFLDGNGEPIIALLNNRRYTSPVTERPRLNTVEIWNLVNTTGDAHPIHLHLVKMQVLGRQPFDVDRYLAAWNPAAPPGSGPAPIPPGPFLTGVARPPEPNERGYKDTVRASPGEVTTVIARFDGYTGVYPWHCHILEHEDHEMMWLFEVVR